MKIPNTLTVLEAAVALETSQQRVLQLIAEGTLKPINTSKGKLRPRWAIPREQIDAMAQPVKLAPILNVPQHI